MDRHSVNDKFKEVTSTSGLSFTLGIVASLVFAGMFLFYIFFPGSYVESSLQLVVESDVTTQMQLQEISDAVNANEYVANASVFLVWAIVGTLLYEGVMFIAHLFQDSVWAVKLLRFRRKDDQRIALETAVVGFCVRVLGVVAVFVIFKAVLWLLPSIILIVSYLNATKDLMIIVLGALGVALGSFVVVHLLAIAARCIALRTRVFY